MEVFELAANLHALYHRNFSKVYLEELTKGMMYYFENCPEQCFRNMKRGIILDFIKQIGNLLKRIYTVKKRIIFKENLQMKIIKRFLTSSFLDRKIDAMKELRDFSKQVRYFSVEETEMTPEGLLQWFYEEGIWEEVFGVRGHTQLMQRADEMVSLHFQKTYATLGLDEDQVRKHIIDIMWKATSRDEQSKIEIYKVYIETIYIYIY